MEEALIDKSNIENTNKSASFELINKYCQVKALEDCLHIEVKIEMAWSGLQKHINKQHKRGMNGQDWIWGKSFEIIQRSSLTILRPSGVNTMLEGISPANKGGFTLVGISFPNALVRETLKLL